MVGIITKIKESGGRIVKNVVNEVVATTATSTNTADLGNATAAIIKFTTTADGHIQIHGANADNTVSTPLLTGTTGYAVEGGASYVFYTPVTFDALVLIYTDVGGGSTINWVVFGK